MVFLAPESVSQPPKLGQLMRLQVGITYVLKDSPHIRPQLQRFGKRRSKLPQRHSRVVHLDQTAKLHKHANCKCLSCTDPYSDKLQIHQHRPLSAIADTAVRGCRRSTEDLGCSVSTQHPRAAASIASSATLNSTQISKLHHV